MTFPTLYAFHLKALAMLFLVQVLFHKNGKQINFKNPEIGPTWPRNRCAKRPCHNIGGFEFLNEEIWTDIEKI